MNVVSHGCTLCSLPREVWMKQRQALLEKDKTFLPLTLQVSLSLSFHSWGCICLSLQSPNAITVNNNEIYLCKRSSLFSMDCSLSLEVLFLLQESEKKRNSSRQYHHDDGPEVTLCCSLSVSLSLSLFTVPRETKVRVRFSISLHFYRYFYWSSRLGCFHLDQKNTASLFESRDGQKQRNPFTHPFSHPFLSFISFDPIPFFPPLNALRFSSLVFIRLKVPGQKDFQTKSRNKPEGEIIQGWQTDCRETTQSQRDWSINTKECNVFGSFCQKPSPFLPDVVGGRETWSEYCPKERGVGGADTQYNQTSREDSRMKENESRCLNEKEKKSSCLWWEHNTDLSQQLSILNERNSQRQSSAEKRQTSSPWIRLRHPKFGGDLQSFSRHFPFPFNRLILSFILL